jgi:hypothetical protein
MTYDESTALDTIFLTLFPAESRVVDERPRAFKHDAFGKIAFERRIAPQASQVWGSNKLANKLRQTDQELIYRHYRELVKPDQSAKYWSIRPATQTNVVAISA